MNQCLNCKYAEWTRTKNGRLHSSGQGRCTYQVKIAIPNAYYFPGCSSLKPSGGWINRKENSVDCPCYETIPKP